MAADRPVRHHQRLAALGRTARLLVWDTAAWRRSRAVRTWLQEHTAGRKRGEGVRILPWFLPSTGPWLTPIEPKGTHGTRTVLAPDRLLAAQELADRVRDCFACQHEPHLAIAEQVA